MPGASRHACHLRPAGNPAPPRPRRREAFISSTSPSRPARQRGLERLARAPARAQEQVAPVDVVLDVEEVGGPVLPAAPIARTRSQIASTLASVRRGMASPFTRIAGPWSQSPVHEVVSTLTSPSSETLPRSAQSERHMRSRRRSRAEHAVGDVVAEEDPVAAAGLHVQEAVEGRHAQDLGARQREARLDAVDRLRGDPAAGFLHLAQHLQQLVGIVPVARHGRRGGFGGIGEQRDRGTHGAGNPLATAARRACRHAFHATPTVAPFLDADLMTARNSRPNVPMVPGAGVEPASLAAAGFKPAAFTSFATRATPVEFTRAGG